MGEATGFLKWSRESADAAAGAGAPARLARGVRAVPRRGAAAPGGSLHGLRHPVLQQRLPARQPHPRLERPRLPRQLARRDRAAARDEQLPRVHRSPVPGAVRGRVRARHQQDPVTIKQVEVEIVDRAWARRLDRGATARGPEREERRGRRIGARRSRRRAAAHAGGARVVVFERADRIGGLLRYGIPEFKMEKRHLERRIEQMSDEGTEFRPASTVGVDVTIERARRGVRRDRPRRRRDCVARSADPRSRARRHLPGDGVPAAREPCAGRRHRRAADHRARQERRDHRRR